MEQRRNIVSEVLPKSGLVYSEKGGFAEVLCKPKIMPLKSAVLEQLQKIESAEFTNSSESKDKAP